MTQNALNAWNGEDDPLTRRIIGAAIEVQKVTGPNMLESTYEECLGLELMLRDLSFERQVHLPLEYKSITVRRAYRMDLLVENAVVVEIKTVDKLLPVHESQVLTYLRMSNLKTGLLINFNCVPLAKGIRRLINPLYSPHSLHSQARATSAGEGRPETEEGAAGD